MTSTSPRIATAGTRAAASGTAAVAWNEIEPDLRSDWERRYPQGGGWERFKAAVRRGWERTSDAVESAIPGDSDRDGR